MNSTESSTPPRAGLFQTHFPPAEFARRRGRIFDAIGKAHALVQAAAPVRGFEVFRQSNEFYYCCGVEVPQAYLLLDGNTRRTSLFLPHRDKAHANEGEILCAEDADLARQLTGVDAVLAVESLSVHLNAAGTIYTPLAPAEGARGCRDVLAASNAAVASDPWDGLPSREQHLAGLLRSRCPRAELRDLSPILDSMRIVKSPLEIDLLRRSGELAARAIVEAMRCTRPGVYEYQLGALAGYIYSLHGARGEGYRAIIAGGANVWLSHYFLNNCVLNGGDLLLMDTAPDFGYYTSDIGRMWPVSGTYLPWQRELYGFMVAYHKTILARIRPSATAGQIMDEAASEMARRIEATAFSKPIYAEAARRTLTFRGHFSHPVGMAVHDVGEYCSRPLAEGTVFAVDPQMWVPEEKLYIRVEDTVAVTAAGAEVLTGSAPLELDDVEKLMRERRADLPLT